MSLPLLPSFRQVLRSLQASSDLCVKTTTFSCLILLLCNIQMLGPGGPLWGHQLGLLLARWEHHQHLLRLPWQVLQALWDKQQLLVLAGPVGLNTMLSHHQCSDYQHVSMVLPQFSFTVRFYFVHTQSPGLWIICRSHQLGRMHWGLRPLLRLHWRRLCVHGR